MNDRFNRLDRTTRTTLRKAYGDIQTVTMTVPLFIRALEFAREDAESDGDLHTFTENAISLGRTLEMEDYDALTEGTGADEDQDEGCTCLTSPT